MTKAKPAAVFQFQPRPVAAGQEAKLALPPRNRPKVTEARPSAMDLSGKTKAVFAIGRGRSGKTVFGRWAAERCEGEGREVILGAADPGNRSMKAFRANVCEPPYSDPERAAEWEQALLMHCAKTQISTFVDLGGGDLSLPTLLEQTPDLVEILREEGIEPVAVYFLGPDPHDLTPLAAMEDAGFRPPATALVLNRHLGSEDSFAAMQAHSAYRAAVDRGAVEIRMPALRVNVMQMVDAESLSFRQASAAFGPFNGASVRNWLKQMEEDFAPILTWLP